MSNFHLSYSSISTYLDCSRRWQSVYRQGIRGVPNDNLLFGTAAHAVVEAFIRGETDNMWESWFPAWAKVLAANDLAHVDWGEGSPEEVEETGSRLFSTPEVHDLLSCIRPKMVDGKPAIERYIEWHLDGLPPIIGYIDCIADDGVPIDFKTAARMWPDYKAAREIQPLFYLAALEQAGEHDHNFMFRHIVMTKARQPKITIFESQRTPAQLEFLETIVRGVWSGISNAIFTPNPMSMWCNESCPIWESCAGAL